MKKVIIISSTPRPNGNSEILANEFARGAKEAENSVEVIELRKLKLNYCLGCYACTKNGKYL